jgi:glycosyltransferase involved in cell wall biosynthesis
LKIVINTAQQRFGGAVQVALSFIHECIHFPEHEYHVWLGIGVGNNIDSNVFPNNFHFYHFQFGPIGFREIRKIQKTLRPYELKIKPDVIISTSGPTYYHSIAPQITGFNLPYHIYPESPFIKELTITKKIKFWLRKQYHYYLFKRDVIAILAQTDDVKIRVQRALGIKDVYTVTNNHSHFYSIKRKHFDKKLPEKSQNEFRWLTLTSYYPHKNLEIIPIIADLLKKNGITNIKFVLTLTDIEFKTHIGNSELILNVGPVSPSECPDLYKECDGMFLPTLAECFSASYPESMIMRKPIITTDFGFSRSICGDAALYYSPKNELEALDKIQQVVASKELQQELVQNGLKELKKFDTARERAYKYLEICKHYIKLNR